MKLIKVLKSFDIFNSETFQFLKDKALNIFLIESANTKQSGIDLISDNTSVNINIVNRPNTYKLLISAQKRMQEKRAQQKKAKEAAKL